MIGIVSKRQRKKISISLVSAVESAPGSQEEDVGSIPNKTDFFFMPYQLK